MNQEALTMEYRQLDRDIVLFEGYDRKEQDLVIETPLTQKDTMEKYEALCRRAREIEAPDPVYALLKNHFNDYLEAMRERVEAPYRNPASRLNGCTWGFSSLMRTDRRPLEERFADFLLRAENQRTIWATAQPFLKDTAQKDLIRWADGLSNTARDLRWIAEEVPDWFTPLGQDAVCKAQQALHDLADNMLEWQAWTRETLITEEALVAEAVPDTEKIVQMEASEYGALLHDTLGVELDELLSWYETEIEKTRAEVLKSAARAIAISGVDEPLPTTVGAANDLLWKYAGPCDSPEEMYARAKVYLARTRALAHEFVDLPEDEQCICLKVPSELRESYPWGGYENGDVHQKPIVGQMFLNQYNYREITDDWIKMNAMHETYPGHHVQFVRGITDPLPQTLKRGAKYIPLIEGTAHRTERAFEWIFGEDPWFPLFVSYRRHHTSVRIKADLMLFYFGRPVEEATQLYMDELGFARHVARGQVQSQINTPGYFTCYYYGMKKLCDWEAEFGYNKKDYTELLFSIGNMSMENVRRYLELSEADKLRFRKDFPSLLMEEEA